MFRGWTSRIVRSVLSVVLISSVTVFTTWNIMDLYMNRLLDRLAITEDIGDVEFRDLLAHIGGGEVKSREQEEGLSPLERITQEQESSQLPNRGSVNIGDAAAEEQSEERETSGETPEEEAPEDAVPVFGNGLIGEAGHQDELVMSADEFAMKQDLLSDEDKMTVFSILFSKVPQHEFQNLSYLLEGGITAGETEEIYEILSQYLTEEELQQLSTILQKYE